MRNRFVLFMVIPTGILFANILSAFDTASVQLVEIEARIIVTSRDFVRELGIVPFVGEGATALVRKNDQEIWLYSLALADHQVYRVPILLEPQFQALLSEIKKFDTNKVLQTPKVQTAKNSQSIILVTPEIKFIEATQVNADGLKKSGDFRISPVVPNFATGGISSDGRVSVVSAQTSQDSSEILIQLLNSRSRRIPGELRIFITPNIVGSADISDPLDDFRATATRRFLVYRAFKAVGADIQSALFLQVIDGDTGAAIGTPKVLRSFRKTEQVVAEFFQSVAIDPDGEYVLYAAYKSSCGKLILYHQALDSNGNPTGRAKVALNCSKVKKSTVGVTGLDILDGD